MLRTSSLQNLLPGISEKLHHLTYFLILCVLSSFTTECFSVLKLLDSLVYTKIWHLLAKEYCYIFSPFILPYSNFLDSVGQKM